MSREPFLFAFLVHSAAEYLSVFEDCCLVPRRSTADTLPKIGRIWVAVEHLQRRGSEAKLVEEQREA